MSMLEYNEIKPKSFILFEDEPYEVLTSHVFRKQQRKPVNAVKMRNVLSGRVVEHSFHVSDKAEEADLSTKPVKFLFSNKGEYWFCEANDPAKRFELTLDIIGEAQAPFMKQNSLVDAAVFDERIISIKLPIKDSFKIKDAPPGIKGDSSKAGMKQVTIETGAVINAPLFIETGETIIVNTQTGEYVERQGK